MKTTRALSILFLTAAPLFSANTGNWIGPTADDNWTLGGNWQGGTIPNAQDDVANFKNSGSGGTVALNGNKTVGTVNFDNGTAYTLSGDTLTLSVASGSAEINITITNGASAHVIASAVSLSDPLTVSQGSTSDFEISGIISGAQTVTLTGTGVLVLSGVNSYSSGTTISGGTLSIGAVSGLGTGAVAIGAATLEFTASFTSTLENSLTGAAQFNTSGGGTTTTWSPTSGITGGGSLTKTGDGTLILTTSNSYTGGTTITTGTLQISNDNQLGATTGALNIGTATLQIITAGITTARSGSFTGSPSTINTNSLISTFSGNFAGSGALTVSGGGTLIFTGTNSYSGGTTLTGAGTTLSGTTSGIQGNVAVGAATILTFNQTTDGTYSGVLSSTGTVNKSGTGNVTFSGASPAFTGPTNVTAGTLTVTGSIANTSLLTVSLGAILSGTGTVGPTTNNGTINPGTGSTGSLLVNGALTLGAGGTVNISIAPLTSDQIVATAAASVNGALVVEPTAGFYGFSPINYTILTSSALAGTFASVTSTNSNFSPSVSYTATDALLTVTILEPFGLFPFSNKNTMAVGENIDALHGAGQLSSDLTTSLDTLVGASFSTINAALDQMHPAPYSAFTEMQVESQSQILSLFHRLPYLPCSCSNPTRFWIDLFGNSLTMKSHGIEFGFQGNSGGAALGLDGELKENVILGFGAAYNRSRLKWHHDHGHGNVDSLFGGIYLDSLTGKFYLGANILAGMDFYETSRHIKFSTIDRHAKASPQALDIMAQIAMAYLFGAPQAFFYPYANFDFLYLHTHNFKENHADGFNLNVHAHTASTLRTEMGLGLQVKDINYDETMCISPKVSIGWVNLCPIERETYKATFQGANIPFTTYGWDMTWNLMNLDFGLTISYYCFSCAIKYDVEFSPDSSTTLYNQNGQLRLDWKW